jgi:integrase
MSIKPKSEVIKNIVEKKHNVNGKSYTKYLIYFGTDGRGEKIRAARSSRKDAIDYINEFYRRMKAVGDAVTALTAAQIYDAQEAFRTLKDAGINRTLTDTVRRFIEIDSGAVSVIDISLGDAYNEYFAGIPVMQALHRKAINQRVRSWVTAFGPERQVREVTAKDVADYLAPFKGVVTTYNNKLSYIKTFLHWCARDEHKYIPVNPIADMRRDRAHYKEPAFLRADDFEKLMRHFESKPSGHKVLNFLVLNYLCGIRREEISRIIRDVEKCVLMDEKSIRVGKPKGWTQGRKPRMFTMPETAYEWLKKGWSGKGSFCYEVESIGRILQRTSKELGISIPKNAGRHTFITMHVAAYEQPETTDFITGTSGHMRSSHYQGLITKAEALKFFDIKPL